MMFLIAFAAIVGLWLYYVASFIANALPKRAEPSSARVMPRRRCVVCGEYTGDWVYSNGFKCQRCNEALELKFARLIDILDQRRWEEGAIAEEVEEDEW